MLAFHSQFLDFTQFFVPLKKKAPHIHNLMSSASVHFLCVSFIFIFFFIKYTTFVLNFCHLPFVSWDFYFWRLTDFSLSGLVQWKYFSPGDVWVFINFIYLFFPPKELGIQKNFNTQQSFNEANGTRSRIGEVNAEKGHSLSLHSSLFCFFLTL